MAKGEDKNHVSFWYWRFPLPVRALSCIGFIVVTISALIGENELRKNYFRAVIAWFCIITVCWLGLFGLGFWGGLIMKQAETWFAQAR